MTFGNRLIIINPLSGILPGFFFIIIIEVSMFSTKRLISLGLAASLLALAACNTMEGVGEDLAAGGKKINKEAEKHKSY